MELKQIYYDIDKAWAKVRKEIVAAGGRVKCGTTCSACCRDKRYFVPLPVSEPEADLILEALDVLSEWDQQKVLDRNLLGTWGACVFLCPDGCLIYKGRPLRCRIYGLPGSPWECKLNSAPDRLPGIAVWAAAVDEALDGHAKLDGGDRISYYDIVEKWRKTNA